MSRTSCQGREKTSRRSCGYKNREFLISGPFGSTQHHDRRPARRKRESHRETKRASHDEWLGRRVGNDGNFRAQGFQLASDELISSDVFAVATRSKRASPDAVKLLCAIMRNRAIANNHLPFASTQSTRVRTGAMSLRIAQLDPHQNL